MDAKDLMIDDWVKCVDSTHTISMFAQVDAIEEGHDCILVKRDISNWFLDIKYLEPIPLTAEILEKNGFVEGRYGEMVLNEELGTSEIYLILEESHDGEYYWWKVNNEIIAKIKSVHELQHVLNVCRFEKNIIL